MHPKLVSISKNIKNRTTLRLVLALIYPKSSKFSISTNKDSIQKQYTSSCLHELPICRTVYLSPIVQSMAIFPHIMWRVLVEGNDELCIKECRGQPILCWSRHLVLSPESRTTAFIICPLECKGLNILHQL